MLTLGFDAQWLLNVGATGYSFFPKNGAAWMYLPKDPYLSYDFSAIAD